MNPTTRRNFILNVLKGTLAVTVMPMPAFPKSGTRSPIVTPPGVRSHVVSKSGSFMTDGSLVPEKPDGMTCIPWDSDYMLLRNHEVDEDGGGVTAVVLDQNLKVKKEFMALAGTSRNCAGGKTVWNTWLSCEETFETFGRKHGYVYEVDPSRSVAENSDSLVAMGRFNHEACGHHENSGYVYLTEDRKDSCFYRFRPFNKKDLSQGGVLEALVVDGFGAHTVNTASFEEGRRVSCSWLEIMNPDPETDILRIEAQNKGAALFVRGEGITVSGDDIIFTCTTGGPNGLGQIFCYNHLVASLEVLYQPSHESYLRKPDNLTFNHFGDLLICEDGDGVNRIVGITPEKRVYVIAESTESEWAGVCMSPDNRYVFANLQSAGLTYAFEIPWHQIR